jgi:hypothetical protein
MAAALAFDDTLERNIQLCGSCLVGAVGVLIAA